MIGVKEITNMNIEEVKLNFFTLMSEIVKTNGDDQEGTGEEGDWRTQLVIVSQQGHHEERLWLQR